MTKKNDKEDSGKSKRARITLECSQETRKSIRISAAQEDKSMNDFILSIVQEKMQKDKEVTGSAKS
ncbi:MAG: hypothetical protein ACRDFB_06015 [Rhabdochlamydiaceae bacterium]